MGFGTLSPDQKMSKEFGRGTRTQAKQAKGKAGGKKYWKKEERQENQFGIDRTREKETCQQGDHQRRGLARGFLTSK